MINTITMTSTSPLGNSNRPYPNLLATNINDDFKITTNGEVSVRCQEIHYMVSSPWFSLYMWVLDGLYNCGLTGFGSEMVYDSLRLENVPCRPRIIESGAMDLFDIQHYAVNIPPSVWSTPPPKPVTTGRQLTVTQRKAKFPSDDE